MSFARHLLSGAAAKSARRRLFLLDYVDATFSRASEAAAVDPRAGWTFYDLATPWPGVNVPRIMGDGAILIEGARTNQCTASEVLGGTGWTAGTGTTTANAATAPDGGADADRTQLSTTQLSDYFIWTPGAAHCFSAYLQDHNAAVGNEFRHGYFGTGAGTGPGQLTLPAAWLRKDYYSTLTTSVGYRVLGRTGDGGAGAAVAVDADIWGVQLEVGGFSSSPIRSAGAAATRALEVCSFADGSVLDSGRWAITICPAMTHTQLAAIGYDPYMLLRDATHYLYVARAGGAPKVRVVVGGAVVAESAALTWSQHQAITITVDWVARQLIIAGATTGNGTTAISGVGTWATATGTALQVGAANGAGGSQFYGVFGRPHRT